MRPVYAASHARVVTAVAAITLTWLQCPTALAQANVSAEHVEEVIVTARKREERLLDVPLSVEVIGGPDIAKQFIDNVSDLVGRVPNLYFSSNVLSPGKDFLNLVIRGVGAQGAGTPAVGTFVDGAYVPALAFDTDFMDVERVEVLRGPQGTLFGRNTEGGALSIVLRRPDADLRRSLAMTYDEFETVRAQATLTGPLSDTWFGALAGDIESSDGYLRNPVIAQHNGGSSRDADANDYRRFSGRGALRFKPSDVLDINVAADFSRHQGLDGYPGVPRGTDDYVVRSEFQIDALYENYGGAATVEYQFVPFLMTSITGYRRVESSLPFDFDGSPEYTGNFHDLRTLQEIVSEEIRVTGYISGGSFRWLAGVYAFSEIHDSDRAFALPQVTVFPSGVFLPADNQHLDREGIAVFADVTWTILDRIDVNAGIRFSREATDSNIKVDALVPDVFGPGQDLAILEEGHDTGV